MKIGGNSWCVTAVLWLCLLCTCAAQCTVDQNVTNPVDLQVVNDVIKRLEPLVGKK